jgi:purine catabolism regulator
MLLIETDQTADRNSQCKRAIAEIGHACRQSLGHDVQIRFGIGRPSDRYSEATRHFREAEQVLSGPPQITSPFFENLGIYRLLLQIQEGYVIDSFVEDYLGPLLRYDKEHGSQLLQTLRVFLDQGCSKQESSDRLYIRRQTLYHRLDKIGELLGDTFTSAEHRICLELALRAHEWFHKPPSE